MPILAVGDVEFHPDGSEMHVDSNDNRIASLLAHRVPDMHVKLVLEGTSALVYIKGPVKISTYTFLTNSNVIYNAYAQRDAITKFWSNFCNPVNGKIAGFTTGHATIGSDYELFIVLENVVQGFRFENPPEFQNERLENLVASVE